MQLFLKKMTLKQLINRIFILIIIFFSFSCNQKLENNNFIKRNKFMPYLHTDLEMSKIDSLILVKYTENEVKDSSRICVKNKYIDNGGHKKWRFMLCDSFEVGYNYKIKIVLNNMVYSYNFEKIVFDTINSFEGYRYDTKSYFLNGVKFENQYCDYVLPDSIGSDIH